MIGKEFTKKILSPVIWGNLIVMALVAIALALGVWIWMDRYTHHGEEIIVPNVEGRLIGDAEYTLSMLELQPIVVDSTYDHTKPSGAITIYVLQTAVINKAGKRLTQ